MATYIDGMDGGKHNSDNIETNNFSQTYTVSVTFECVSAENPREAAELVARWLVEEDEFGNAYTMIYAVEDELTNKEYTVDLSEDDEDVSVHPK